jgi:hypothetical protein
MAAGTTLTDDHFNCSMLHWKLCVKKSSTCNPLVYACASMKRLLGTALTKATKDSIETIIVKGDIPLDLRLCTGGKERNNGYEKLGYSVNRLRKIGIVRC